MTDTAPDGIALTPDVKLSGTLPKDPDQNGLLAVAKQMIDRPGVKRIAIVVLDSDGSTTKFSKGTHSANVTIERIEVIHPGEDLRDAQRLLVRSNQRRHGVTVLPLELEKDVEEAFSRLVDDGTFPPGDDD